MLLVVLVCFGESLCIYYDFCMHILLVVLGCFMCCVAFNGWFCFCLLGCLGGWFVCLGISCGAFVLFDLIVIVWFDVVWVFGFCLLVVCFAVGWFLFCLVIFIWWFGLWLVFCCGVGVELICYG